MPVMKVLMDDAVLESLLPVSPAFQQVYRVRGANDGKEGGGGARNEEM